MIYLAHAGHDEAAETATESGLLDALTHQPAWVSLLIIAFVMFGLYTLLEKLKVKPFNRILALLPVLILIAIIYMQHSPLVTTVILSVGFVATFFIAFTMIASGAHMPKPKVNKNDEGTK